MCRGIRIFSIALFLVVMAGCGSSGSSGSSSNSTSSSDNNTTTTSSGNNGSIGRDGSNGTGSSPAQHVVIVVFENQDYSNIIGNSRMPFLNRLATQNALATQFYANTHPSVGNYLMLVTGQVITNDDKFAGTISADNIARQLSQAGKTWKVYAESLPSPGYTGNNVYPYIKHHNPFAYLDDVINSASEKANIVPFSQFTIDINNDALPSFSLVVPNNLSNGHDCADGTGNCALSERLATIDTWLSTNFAGVVQDTSFMGSSVLIVALDEAATDNRRGGGRIPVVLAGSSIKTGFQSANVYQFQSLLKFSLDTLGVRSAPGAAASAPSMREFLK